MKRVFIMYLALAAALTATGTDRFYIEDFTINPGETKQVSIILDNETQYTAFQSDIYLPKGLTVEQDDGDLIFYLTSRKSRDHIIMGQYRNDGAIRIMSYSLQVKPYSGNNGALVTFNVTASSNFVGGTIELKNSLFTTLDEQEISLVNESCQVNTILKDLTGEILISEESGGGDTNVYIKYTGDEDVAFTIYLYGGDDGEDLYDLTHDYSDCLVWDDMNKLLIIDLKKIEGLAYITYYPPIEHYPTCLTYYFTFEVSAHANGYNDLSNTYSTWYERHQEDGYELKPSIGVNNFSDLTYYIHFDRVTSHGGWSHYCSSGTLIYDSDWVTGEALYAVDRLDHDYYVNASATNSDFYGYQHTTTCTILVPARTCNLSISQYDSIKPGQDFFIIDNMSSFHVGEKELGADFAIVESSGWGIVYNCDNSISRSITVDSQQISDHQEGLKNTSIAICLLPFGDIYGGEHYIETTCYDVSYDDMYISPSFCNSLSIDTIVEYHPISTRLTPDFFIFDVDSGMSNAMLHINGEEVELSTDGDALYYALERTNNDYTVTVQVGDKITNDFGEEYSAWSQETTVVVPAKSHPGDVNGDGLVNVGDVTALIQKVLGVDIEPFYPANAELTGDENLNVADVTTLIQMVLNN